WRPLRQPLRAPDTGNRSRSGSRPREKTPRLRKAISPILRRRGPAPGIAVEKFLACAEGECRRLRGKYEYEDGRPLRVPARCARWLGDNSAPVRVVCGADM